MKKMINICVILLLGVVVSNIDAQREVITKTLALEKGGTLKIEVNPGDIDIKTWNKNEALVKVDGLDEDDLRHLDISSSGNTVTIKYVGKWGWGSNADYSITVPAQVNLDLHTTSGDIKLTNDIEGDVKINTMAGDISVRSITGNAKLETMGGDIFFEKISGRATVSSQGGNLTGGDIQGSATEVKTMGGDIKLSKINNVRKVTTFGGDIDVDQSNGDVELTTFGGEIRLDQAQNSVRAKTYGGNIFIGNANGFIDVSTGGGNIELKNITGSINARTSAGNIYANLTPTGDNDSELRTDAGDIIITLPSNVKVNVEAIANAADWGKDNRRIIRSDFDGDIRDNRGQVEGDFTINGGGAKINLKTTFGDIQIKKKN
jgi:DUF4097 and DUF4098 domain-containing protein YvlB